MIPDQDAAVGSTAEARASAATPPAVAPWPQRSAGDLLAAALLAGWAVFLLMRIRYGFDGFDGGMYLSVTDRLVRGDIPFRDDRELPLCAFNILLAGIAKPFGGFSLIGARSLGVVFQLAQMAVIWLALRRFAGAWTAALAACLVPCLPLFGIWAPGYNEISCTTTVIGGALLALASAGGRFSAIFFGLGAGTAFALGVLSYVPMVPLGAVPVAMAAWGLWRSQRRSGRGHGWLVGLKDAARDPWFRGGAAAVVAMTAILILAALVIIAAGIGPDWLAAVHTTVKAEDDTIPITQRVAATLANWYAPGCHLVVVAVGLVAARSLARRPAAGTGSGVLAGAIVLGLLAFVARDPLTNVLRVPHLVNGSGTDMWIINLWYQLAVVGLAMVLVFTVPAVFHALRSRGRHHQEEGPAGWAIALAVFATAMAINALASSSGGFNGLNLRATMLAMGAAGFGIFLRDCPRAPARPLAFAAITAHIVIAAAVGCAGWLLVYKDSPPSACTATFTLAPLNGVHSTPDRVAPLTALQAWVAAHEPTDARCICYHDAPVLYFAIGRRPALARTWVSPWWSWQSAQRSYAVLDDLLANMHERGRRPDFCVRQLIQDGEPWPYAYCLADPLHAFVQKHFYPVWRTWPYEVLLPRDATHPEVEPETIADPCGTAPFSPDAQVVVAQGADLSPDGAGGLVLTVPGIDQTAVACQLLVHGGDEVSLRLRVDSDDPDLFVLLAHDQQFSLAGGRAQGDVPGWDVTFPAGAEGDRGFALGLPPTSSNATRHVHLHLLRLERFAPPPNAGKSAEKTP